MKPRPALPRIDGMTDLVELGVQVDRHLEEIGEFRPGEAWGDCATRVDAMDPALASWLRTADRRWDELIA